jgi:hypothetical protein
MSYDSNTKVALLVAKFSEVLLFSFSALSLSNNHVFTDLLKDYRGIEEEDNYQQLINKLLDAYRLTTPSIVDFDGTLVTFETNIWYRDIKFILDARQHKLRIAKQNGQAFIDVSLPSDVGKSAEGIFVLAKDILGKAKAFHATPSLEGYDLERRY